MKIAPLAAVLLATIATVAHNGARAQQADNEVNLSTTIIGNQEQPKVLYIVPWKSVTAAELGKGDFASQLNMVFGHVEPSELRRELNYRKRLEQAASETSE